MKADGFRDEVKAWVGDGADLMTPYLTLAAIAGNDGFFDLVDKWNANKNLPSITVDELLAMADEYVVLRYPDPTVDYKNNWTAPA